MSAHKKSNGMADRTSTAQAANGPPKISPHTLELRATLDLQISAGASHEFQTIAGWKATTCKQIDVKAATACRAPMLLYEAENALGDVSKFFYEARNERTFELRNTCAAITREMQTEAVTPELRGRTYYVDCARSIVPLAKHLVYLGADTALAWRDAGKDTFFVQSLDTNDVKALCTHCGTERMLHATIANAHNLYRMPPHQAACGLPCSNNRDDSPDLAHHGIRKCEKCWPTRD